MGNEKDKLARKKTDKPVKKEDAPLAVKEGPEGPAGDSAHDSRTEELKRQLAEKTEQADAYYAQLQRVQADFENYQKRMEAEMSKIADKACETLISGLLDTLDNFDRAIANLEKLPEQEAKGVLMVYRNMLDYLESSGLMRIGATGCQFDPRKHDAIMREVSADQPVGTVLDEYQAGYSMRGNIIRPSKVKVAKEKDKNENIQKEE